MTTQSNLTPPAGPQPMVPTVKLGELTISRLILGGNPFSGFSHQNPTLDREMVQYFSVARIKELLRQAESLGVTTVISRADRHIMRTLQEYWFEGGSIQWIAQTAPEFASLQGNIGQAIAVGAKAVYIHGGQMDFFHANNRLDVLPAAIDQIHAAGLPAGVAGHYPHVHRWAADNLPVDFHMCSYYNPSRRDGHAEHRPGEQETFDDADRDAMLQMIPTLAKPVIHYKIFAAGRKDPRESFQLLGRHLRPGDAVCIGVYPKHNPNMLLDDIRMFCEVQ